MPRARLASLALAASLAACAGSDPAPQGGVLLSDGMTGSNGLSIRVTSIRERRFLTTARQQRDFSCGSAVLATLLTHHYAMPTTEDEVFRDMIASGDRIRIERDGFSMLDMQRYLGSRGLRAAGYRIPLDRMQEVRVPAVALINRDGYRHFVVLRGVEADRVLISDPSTGARTMRRDSFEEQWNGVLFLVTDRLSMAQATFGRPEDWDVQPRAPGRSVRDVYEALPTGTFGTLDRRYF